MGTPQCWATGETRQRLKRSLGRTAGSTLGKILENVFVSGILGREPVSFLGFCRDTAVIDKHGYGQIVGRMKDMIIRGGENIYPR